MPYVALLISVITLTLWVRSWFDPAPPEPLKPISRTSALESFASPFVAVWAFATLAVYALGFLVGILWPFALILWVAS